MSGLLLLLAASLLAGPGAGKPVSVIEFHGWSPASDRVGWSLERRGGDHHSKKIWYVRETHRTAHGKARLQRVKLSVDERFPGYFQRQGYLLHDLPSSASEKRTRTEISLRYNRTLVIELHTEEKIRLYYWLEEGTDRILLHKASFNEIYFAFDARAWVSPDGRRVALALSLDGDIRVDAALVVLVLPVSGWQDDVSTEEAP